MGIPRGAARLLLDEHRDRPFSGTLLQLGRSTVYFSQDELATWAPAHGVVLKPLGRPVALSHDPRLAAQRCIDDRSFFGQLGFSRVESIDIADWEGADHIADLNQPVPSALHERFDVIFETGTIVQIYDIAQVFRNLYAMLAPGGRVVHAAVPSSNHVDLGFTMFSPALLHDLYTASGYRIECSLLCSYRPFWHRGRLHSPPWRIYKYDPEVVGRLSFGGFGDAQLTIFVVATKLPGSRGDVVPQLGQYRETWSAYARGEVAAAGSRSAAPAEGASWGGKLDRFAARHPWLDAMILSAKPFKRRYNHWRDRRRLELIARY